MNQSKRSFSFLVFPLLFLLCVSAVVAQPDGGQLEPSYEIALHVIIGSNEPGARADVPPGLSNVSKYLKSNFSFSHYRLANTFLGRISNTGNVEYKSVSNILGQENDAESQTFLEWSMVNFRSAPNGFQARSFRFGARVPVRTGTFKDGTGMNSVVNYEAIGLTMTVIGLPANTPTLIGTISLPKTTGTIFLVATVRAAAL
jgi:hypothetical protein